MRRLSAALFAVAFLALTVVPAHAQWTNRYPRLAGYSHHVYVEGYNMPTVAAGPLYPAPSPDGRSIAFSARGWIWLLDADTGAARRVTRGAGMDSRPAWSPDARTLAFVRDDTRDTWIVLLDVASGEERIAVDDPGIVLDPAFSPDGGHLLYAAAGTGSLNLWRLDLASGVRGRITNDPGMQLRPIAHPDGEHIVYLAKRGSDEIRLRSLTSGAERVLHAGRILAQTRPALSPDGRTLAVNLPTDDGWELRLMDLAEPGPTIVLTRGRGMPLTPAWSADGTTIYFAEADPRHRFRLWQIPYEGGPVAEVRVSPWSWGEQLGTVRITTRQAGGEVPARLAVTDAGGHPLLPEYGLTWFDGQNGAVFFYSPGTIELTVPAGVVRVAAARGLETPVVVATTDVAPGAVVDIDLTLEAVWDARAAGWLSGDHHFHLNYGGPYLLAPEDLLSMVAGEGLDVATPLVANLHNRYEDEQHWGWEQTEGLPFMTFGQEVRSHFAGHVGLVGIHELFFPWIWGPGYEVFRDDDRSNAEALAHARRQRGIGAYVHPVGVRDPFAEGNERSIPLEMIPDGVLGDLEAVEVVCLWTDELGTSEVWYRLLNLGRPVVPTAGTDVMTDFFRTMAVGTVRVYVRAGEDASYGAYLEGLRAGRSFVTTGPLLDFRVAGAGPGEVVATGTRSAEWELDLYSATEVDRIEIVVNGRVVHAEAGLAAPGRRTYRGTVDLPEGGWIAARAVGDEPAGWPTMSTYPFAHTAATWLGRVGSTEPAAEREAARDLLRALDVAEARLEAGYEGTEIPLLRERFRQARAELERRVAP
jgi:TolB protein